MATNILWAFPDITLNASAHTLPNKGALSGHDLDTVVSAARSKRFYFDATSDKPAHLFDLGSGYTLIDNTADYLIVSDAKATIKDGSTLILLAARAATSGAFTSIVSNAWSTSDLVGPHDKDYITTFNTTSAYRQWQVQFHASANTANFPHGQIYFGRFFDFGRDPTSSSKTKLDYNQDKGIHQALDFEFKYEGITETKRDSFEDKMGQYKDENTIFLYSRSYHAALFGQRLINCQIVDYKFTQQSAFLHDLEISLREVF